MGRLVYSAITSLDGYVADASGGFDWATPDEQVHAVVNDLERAAGTYLYGRRMYQVMRGWQDVDPGAGPPEVGDFARLWQAADKVVHSRTLEAVDTPRTRLVRSFDPDQVRRLVASSERDVTIGGPDLAAAGLRAGLVDECHLFVNPVVVGGGTPALPDDLRLRLALVSAGQFDNGVVHLHYRLL